MKRALEYIRVGFVSLEFIILAAGAALVLWSPPGLAAFLLKVPLSPSIRATLTAAIPLSCLVFIFTCYRKIVFPEKDKRDHLRTWPDYWKMRVALNVSGIYAVVFLLVAAISYVVDWNSNPTLSFTMLLTGVVGSAADGLSVFLAEIRVNEIFIETKPV